MDLRRVRVWEWLTGLTGFVLVVSLFLPWYSAGGQSATAWQSFAVIDVILGLAGVGAMALPAIAAAQRTAAVPQAWSSGVVWLLLVAAVLAVIRLLDPPGQAVTRDAGVWIAAVASLAVVAFDIKSMRDKSFPAAMRPRLNIETMATPSSDGTRHDVS
jgi:hypothetical protein